MIDDKTQNDIKNILIENKIDNLDNVNCKEITQNNLLPLFKDEEEYLEFLNRHSSNKAKRGEIYNYSGNIFIGIDAGSTTTK